MRQPHRPLPTTLLLLTLAGALAACAGDTGPQGAAGPTGATGPAGQPGADGSSALIATATEPPGANCASGGVQVTTGFDANRNGVLDAGEVNPAATTYVCSSTAINSLVLTAAEPAGANCPFGGTRVQSGLDANGNGALDAAEVNPAATSFVCALGPSGTISPSTGIHVNVTSVSTAAGAPITVRFTLKDDRGFPLDVAGVYSLNTAIQPRFALATYSADPATGLVSPMTVYTKTTSVSVPAGQPTNFNPASSANYGTLVENGLGAGDYTYTFPTTSVTNGPQAVAYDPTRLDQTHVVWIQATRQTDLVYATNANTYYAANQPYYYVPSGAGAPLVREVASNQGCTSCHAGFKAETTTSAAFHGGGRIDVGMCNVCHNPARVSNPAADSSSFVHRIHAGKSVADANLFHGIAATYPRDVRDCDACHGNAAQGAQALTNPSTRACQGCHDYVSFTGAAPITCGVNGALALGTDGKPLPCNHVGGQSTDATCATCHGPTAGFPTARYHVPVVPPDPANAWLPGGTNNNTNASFVAAGGVVPAGASVITYDLKSVEAVLDTGVTPNVKRPQITFKLKRDGTDVVFQTYAAGSVTELMPNFVGSPSVYFAWAVPQDGMPSPSDFNATASGYLKKLWDGSATGSGAGTLTGPDASGYYTVRLTGVQIPATATLLTGGVGYSYSLSSTPPLVQTNVPGYPWTANVPADGKAQGGLSVPAPNVWKTAVGFAGRRSIVDNAKCKACHGALGVAPTFHAGQRNDGPTCSFCHTPNRTSSGWAASSKYFIHAIHAGRKRSVPFTWHAAAAGPGYGEVEFPGTLNRCTGCHVPGTYDFVNASNLNALPSEPLTTVATGIYNGDPFVNSTYFTISPYVIADGVFNYGTGFSYNAGTNVTTEAAPTTLVLSPLTAACAACHDSSIALDHMQAGGGQFYAQRSSALFGPKEQCLICHGPGRTAAIGDVHQR